MFAYRKISIFFVKYFSLCIRQQHIYRTGILYLKGQMNAINERIGKYSGFKWVETRFTGFNCKTNGYKTGGYFDRIKQIDIA